MRKRVGFGRSRQNIHGLLMACTIALGVCTTTRADEPGNGQGGEGDEPEYGVFLTDEGVAVKYRIVHRVPGEYENRKTVSLAARIGWFSMHAEYEYGAQVLPHVVHSWLTGVVGNIRQIISCKVPADRLKVRRKDEFDIVGVPRVGDRIAVKKRIKYEFAIEWLVEESGVIDVGFVEIPLFQLMHRESKELETGWMTEETQLWEVVELLEANGPTIPSSPVVPNDSNMTVPTP